VTGGDRTSVVGSQSHSGVQSPDFLPVTMQYVYTVKHNFFMSQVSDLAPLSSVYPQRWSLPQVLSRHGFWVLTCCSSVTDVENWKGQNTGGAVALAVTKGLVGKFPSTLY